MVASTATSSKRICSRGSSSSSSSICNRIIRSSASVVSAARMRSVRTCEPTTVEEDKRKDIIDGPSSSSSSSPSSSSSSSSLIGCRATGTSDDRTSVTRSSSTHYPKNTVGCDIMYVVVCWFEVVLTAVLTLLLAIKNYLQSWSFWRNLRWSSIRRSNQNTSEKKIKTARDVPGPKAYPLIGSSWVFFKIVGLYKMEKAHEAYRDMRRRYGSLCKQESYGNHPIISLYNRDDIETILKRASRFPLRPGSEVIAYYRQTRKDRYANLGLVNEQGVTWQKLRTSLTPELMGAKTILGYFPALNGVTDDFIDLIRNRRVGNTVNQFEELAYRMGLESTCMLMLGKHLDFLKPDSTSTMINDLADAVRMHFLASRDAFYGFPAWKIVPTSSYKNFTSSEEAIYTIIITLMENTQDEQKNFAKDGDIEAVFQSILKEKNLDIREKRAAIVDFIAAGIHTVGNTLVFLLHTIGRNQRVQKQLQLEADSLAPQNCDISVNNLKNAKYIRAFITEVFRLLPTAPCIARILEEPANFGDYHLAEGTVVLLQTWIAGMDEANFQYASECIPERWLDPDKYKPHSPQLVAPFGFGRRICPGKRFVELALQLMVAKIVREFDITADEELGLQFEYIVAPKGPVNISFRDRSDTT